MASDTIGPTNLIDFQEEVLLNNLYPEGGNSPVWDEKIVNEAWRWCIENDINPRHVENTLIQTSKNFAPQAGGEPLVLGNEVPDEVREEYPDFTVPEEWKADV